MSAPFDTNAYKATIIRHVDADTTWAMVSLGFDCKINLSFRWAGIDAPERNTDAGKRAIKIVNEWLPVGSSCTITTVKDSREKFGRYLATFHDSDGESLNKRLIDEGYAVAYDGGPR